MADTVFLFLRSLWGSWIAWAGGILRMIPFFESLIEPKIKPLLRKFPSIDEFLTRHGAALKKDLRPIALLCLFIGCYRAWVFEHRNAENAMYGKDGKSEAWAKFNACDAERSSQQQTINSQQLAVNACMIALGKQGKPELLAVVVKEAAFQTKAKSQNTGNEWSLSVLVISVNKVVTPVHGTLKCNAKFSLLGGCRREAIFDEESITYRRGSYP